MASVESALVLGAGGVTGVAWEVGVLAGLREAGVDLSTADLVVGTSAGSAVAAQVTSGTPVDDLYRRQLAGFADEVPARLGAGTLARYLWAMLRERDPRAFGARMGRLALAARTVDEARRREAIASRLPSARWPGRPLWICAVNAATGDFRVFDRDSGVDLVDAVAASCAVPGVWPPVTIGADRWIDGGMRSAANADLAEGAARVAVLAPIPLGLGPMTGVARQAEALRSGGARVVVLSPDAGARRAMGRNTLDPSRRAPAALQGHRQGLAAAAEVARTWGGSSEAVLR